MNDLETLKEYFKYKYALQNYGSNFKSTKLTIKEKINDYKNECLLLEKEKHIYIETFFKKVKKLDTKKRKIHGFGNENIKNLKKRNLKAKM